MSTMTSNHLTLCENQLSCLDHQLTIQYITLIYYTGGVTLSGTSKEGRC